ncbi:MAG: EAL domain-containing protein [Alphaproteobacteria bacterium]
MSATSPAVIPQARDGASPELAPLRRERDRFAAFSFCVADILLELDDAQTIVFATGAVKALLHQAPDALAGRRLVEIASREYAGLVNAVLSSAREQNRMSPVSIRLGGQNGPTPPLQTTGYYLPNLPGLGGRYYLALRLDTAQLGPPRQRNPETGLLDTNGFADSVARRLSRDSDADLKVTLVQVGNLETLRRKLDEESRKALMVTIGAYLRASSLDGDSAGQFDSDHFGLLRSGEASIAPVCRQLREFSRSIDPDGVGLDIADADFSPEAIGLDPSALSRRDIARVLVHAINAFDADDEDLNIDDMARSLGTVARATVGRIARFRTTVAEGAFSPAFQPIVDIATGRPHHFEALARFSHDSEASPGTDIRFAEDLGLITEFDLKMTGKVIDWLRTSNKLGMRYHIAVNLSGRSLSSRAFVERLLVLLDEAGDVREQVLFEVTETARIEAVTKVSAVLGRLRELGHRICLDDFGAGAATFQYLRAFDVDIVKLDGALVHEAATSHKGKAFLGAIVGMCEELGIATVAEMVESEQMMRVVRDAGVPLAQGFFLGRPAADVSAYEAPRPTCFEDRKNSRLAS